jgi:hypothetical protein
MPASADCPGMECWQALFRDALPPDERERWARHLESCPRCQERLDQPREVDEALRRRGRRVGDPTLAPHDPAWSQFLERLHAGRSAVRVGPVEPADLYFLRPDDRPGLLGTLGPYEVREVLGQGGMGVVLKAFDPALHRLVAIKVLAPALAGSATARRRFTREAQAAAAICHDHVVAVHGVHEADGLPYLVMQYVPGESLQERLDRAGPLEVTEVVRIGLQAASGLAAAHAQGLIHRDVKPANILLEDGLSRVKVTDFGLARMADDIGLTQAGVVAGTPEYMAPEQARGEQVDHRADLFSLGSVLYACCTGRPPFRGSTPLAVLRQVSDEAPRPVRSLNPDVPAWLEAVILRLLAKDPADRFQSAAEAAALLEGYLAHLRQPATVAAPELALPPGGGRSKPRPRAEGVKRLPRGLWPLALVLLALSGIGLAVFGFSGAAGEPKPEARYSHPLKGRPNDLPGLSLVGGPDADPCVRFEADGLRITLPAGAGNGWRPTGVATGIAVRGDFEITVNFEILQESVPKDGGGFGTRLSLMIGVDRPNESVVKLSRGLAPTGASQFIVWSSLWDSDADKAQVRGQAIPTAAKTGRLRLVRAGPVLSSYVAGGPGEEFALLEQQPLGREDLKNISIVGGTSSGGASLDARVTDLLVRAESLPNMPTAAAPTGGGKPWLTAAVLLGVVLILALGVWLYLRQSRPPRLTPAAAPVEGGQARPEAAPPSVSFPCPGCGKDLRARPELAGRRVKCPGCRQAVVVPNAGAGEAGTTSG